MQIVMKRVVFVSVNKPTYYPVFLLMAFDFKMLLKVRSELKCTNTN